jgi:lipopolysaccharide transport system permease protein
LLIFALRDLKVRYTQTLLGPAWLIIQSLTLTAVFTTIISGVAGISTGNQPAPLFYLTALIIWSYFSQIVSSTSQVFLANEYLFSKIYFPRIIVPLSALLSNAIGLVIQLLVLLMLLFAYEFLGKIGGLSWRVAVFPIVVIQFAAFSLAIGLGLGASAAKYRDMAHATPFVIQVWMFITPIIYPFSSIPETYRTLVSFINPLAVAVEASRWCFLGISSAGVDQIVASIVSTVLALAGSVIVYQRVERTVMDTI